MMLVSQDIAVLTDNTSLCSFYREESFNVRPRGICRGQSFANDNAGDRPFSPHNNKEDCEGDGKCVCVLVCVVYIYKCKSKFTPIIIYELHTNNVLKPFFHSFRRNMVHGVCLHRHYWCQH